MQETKEKALIIEDDPDLVYIFSRALELSGFQTKTVSNGAEAIALLGQMAPDVVVLDLHLPEVSGSKILATIRASESLAHTKVVLATADHLTAESLREDADLVLLKPISFKQLRDLSGRLRRKPETVQHSD